MSHGHDDFETEPVPGLPKRLPAGEDILWQGAPDRGAIAVRTFHLRKLAVYAAIIVAWRGITVVYDGGTLTEGVLAAAILGGVSAAAIGILYWIAGLVAGGTIYTITNKRLVMRFGIALPMTVQIPFSKIVSAAVRRGKDGIGDIPVTVSGRVSYWVMWPHARPWHLLRPEPMLRGVPEVDTVAKILGDALRDAFSAAADEAETETQVAPTRRAAPRQSQNGRADGNLAAAAG